MLEAQYALSIRVLPNEHEYNAEIKLCHGTFNVQLYGDKPATAAYQIEHTINKYKNQHLFA